MNHNEVYPREYPPTDFQTVGEEIGNAATQHGEERAAQYCAAERRRIELKNQSSIRALTAKIAALRDIEAGILH